MSLFGYGYDIKFVFFIAFIKKQLDYMGKLATHDFKSIFLQSIAAKVLWERHSSQTIFNSNFSNEPPLIFYQFRYEFSLFIIAKSYFQISKHVKKGDPNLIILRYSVHISDLGRLNNYWPEIGEERVVIIIWMK